MRIYQNPMEMIKEVERDLFEMGIRYQSETVQDQKVAENPQYQTIELTGYAYSLTGFDPEKMREMVGYLKNNLDWATAEKTERLEGVPKNHRINPGTAWFKHSDKWRKFLRDGVFAYSYVERWQQQLDYVIAELLARPNTRQAIMTMYDVHQDLMNWGGRDRVPCSLTYQFIRRDDGLTLIYNQRSCDFMGFFATDVFITAGLLGHVAQKIGTRPARLVHFIGSLHAFAKDLGGRNIF
jgi:thymidylate synthase